jgi:hypothetical protein
LAKIQLVISCLQDTIVDAFHGLSSVVTAPHPLDGVIMAGTPNTAAAAAAASASMISGHQQHPHQHHLQQLHVQHHHQHPHQGRN